MVQRTKQTKLAFCNDLWMSFRIIIVQSVPCIFLNADSARKGSQESESLTFPHWWCTKLKHVYQTTMRNWVLPKIGCIVPKLGKTGGNLGRGGAPQTDGSAPVSYYWCQYLQRGRAGPLISTSCCRCGIGEEARRSRAKVERGGNRTPNFHSDIFTGTLIIITCMF